jgi:hypothetical protein
MFIWNPNKDALKERSYGHFNTDCQEGGYPGPLQRFLVFIGFWFVLLDLLSGMASPLVGIAGVNSLLFACYGASKRIISPFGQLSLPQTALAGAMAGAANAILASPGSFTSLSTLYLSSHTVRSGDVQSTDARPVWVTN